MLGRWRVPLRIPREVPHPCHTYRSIGRSVLRTCAARSAGDPASPASASWAAQARGRTRSSSARTAWPCAPRSWPRRTRSCPSRVLPHATEALTARRSSDGSGSTRKRGKAGQLRDGPSTEAAWLGLVCDLRWAFSSSDLPSPAHGVGRRPEPDEAVAG